MNDIAADITCQICKSNIDTLVCDICGSRFCYDCRGATTDIDAGIIRCQSCAIIDMMYIQITGDREGLLRVLKYAEETGLLAELGLEELPGWVGGQDSE